MTRPAAGLVLLASLAAAPFPAAGDQAGAEITRMARTPVSGETEDVRVQGAVFGGGLAWTCLGRRCDSHVLGWPAVRPACHALVAEVGPVVAFRAGDRSALCRRRRRLQPGGRRAAAATRCERRAHVRDSRRRLAAHLARPALARGSAPLGPDRGRGRHRARRLRPVDRVRRRGAGLPDRRRADRPAGDVVRHRRGGLGPGGGRARRVPRPRSRGEGRLGRRPPARRDEEPGPGGGRLDGQVPPVLRAGRESRRPRRPRGGRGAARVPAAGAPGPGGVATAVAPLRRGRWVHDREWDGKVPTSSAANELPPLGLAVTPIEFVQRRCAEGGSQ